MTTQDLYDQYRQYQYYGHMGTDNKRTAKDAFERALAREAAKVFGNQPGLEIHVNVQRGDTVDEDKTLDEKFTEIINPTRDITNAIDAVTAELRRYYESCRSGEECSLEKFLRRRRSDKRLKVPLFPATSTSDFTESGLDYMKRFGMRFVDSNLKKFGDLVFQNKSIKYNGQDMLILSNKLDRTGFPLYGFGISRSVFPVSTATVKSCAFPSNLPDAGLAAGIPKKKMSWLLTMYAITLKKMDCIAKKINAKVRNTYDSAVAIQYQTGEYHSFNARVASLANAMNPVASDLTFLQETEAYLGESNFLDILSREHCTAKDIIDLLLFEPVELYPYPYKKMNAVHDAFKAALYSFSFPLLKLEGWVSDVDSTDDVVTSKKSAFRATQCAYALKWFNELAENMADVKLDLEVKDDTYLATSTASQYVRELCDYLNGGTIPYFVKSHRTHIGKHTIAVLKVILDKQDANVQDLDVEAISKMQEGFLYDEFSLHFGIAFEYIHAEVMANRTAETMTSLVELLAPSSKKDKILVAVLCFELGLELVHQGLYRRAITWLQFSLFYNPVEDADDLISRTRKRVTYQLLWVTCQLTSDPNATFYGNFSQNFERFPWKNYPYARLPNNVSQKLATKTPAELKTVLCTKLLYRLNNTPVDGSEADLVIVAVNLGLDGENRKAAFKRLKESDVYVSIFGRVGGHVKAMVDKLISVGVEIEKTYRLVKECKEPKRDNIMAKMRHNSAVKEDNETIDLKLGFINVISEDTYPADVSKSQMPWGNNPYLDCYSTAHAFFKIELLAQDDPLAIRMREQEEGKEQDCDDSKQEVFDLWAHHLKKWMDMSIPGLNPPRILSHDSDKNVVEEHSRYNQQRGQRSRDPVWEQTAGYPDYMGQGSYEF
jgi:hypothetical protein